MKYLSVVVIALLMCTSRLPAQTSSSSSPRGLRDKLQALFIFGSGQSPIFLGGTSASDEENVARHGNHFIPEAVGLNQKVISFLQGSIAANVANLPLSATSSSYSLEPGPSGLLVAVAGSAGPIFAEGAQTLGRGRVFVAANVTRLDFTSLRGINLDAIGLNFTHDNVGNSLMGDPLLENDIIHVDLSLDVSVTAFAFVATYGLSNRVDVGFAIPIVSTTLGGSSIAQVVPFGAGNPDSTPQAVHFFGGTQERPNLFASAFARGSASGVGDVAARVKIAVSESQQAKLAILGDVRFPTGSEADLLGSGEFSVRGLGILSAQFGSFAPHLNVGYHYKGGSLQTDAVLLTAGFTHALAEWATLAVDVVSELQVGENAVELPEAVAIDVPFERLVQPTNLPDRRDDIVNGSIGLKLRTSSNLTTVVNSIWPMNHGGLRPNVVWTLGLEYSF